jgi:hypothetical protein
MDDLGVTVKAFREVGAHLVVIWESAALSSERLHPSRCGDEALIAGLTNKPGMLLVRGELRKQLDAVGK